MDANNVTAAAGASALCIGGVKALATVPGSTTGGARRGTRWAAQRTMAGEVARPRSRRLTVVPRKVAGHGETAVGKGATRPSAEGHTRHWPEKVEPKRWARWGGGPAALQVDLPPPGEPLRTLPIRGFEEAPGAASGGCKH